MFSGWGPSGRRFKSCLPDRAKARLRGGHSLSGGDQRASVSGSPTDGGQIRSSTPNPAAISTTLSGGAMSGGGGVSSLAARSSPGSTPRSRRARTGRAAARRPPLALHLCGMSLGPNRYAPGPASTGSSPTVKVALPSMVLVWNDLAGGAAPRLLRCAPTSDGESHSRVTQRWSTKASSPQRMATMPRIHCRRRPPIRSSTRPRPCLHRGRSPGAPRPPRSGPGVRRPASDHRILLMSGGAGQALARSQSATSEPLRCRRCGIPRAVASPRPASGT